MIKDAAEEQACYGKESIVNYVVSMATSVSDLLEVNLLLLEAGLYRPGETPEADIMAVPLFETVADLEAAPQVMADWFALPEIAAITAARGYQIGRAHV